MQQNSDSPAGRCALPVALPPPERAFGTALLLQILMLAVRCCRVNKISVTILYTLAPISYQLILGGVVHFEIVLSKSTGRAEL
jgi:hypothetical protein